MPRGERNHPRILSVNGFAGIFAAAHWSPPLTGAGLGWIKSPPPMNIT